ncbi:hypothetical protein ES703_82934 [subsurface metagenome]
MKMSPAVRKVRQGFNSGMILKLAFVSEGKSHCYRHGFLYPANLQRGTTKIKPQLNAPDDTKGALSLTGRTLSMSVSA